MKSINFTFLQKNNPDLEGLAMFAEQYVYSDPASSLVKLRQFIEQMIKHIYLSSNFEKLPQSTLMDLLSGDSFKTSTPAVVLDKFHIVRRGGNKGAHGGGVITKAYSLEILKEGFDLARWYHLAFNNGHINDCSEFKAPALQNPLKEHKKAVEKLSAQEVQLNQVIEELDKVKQESITYKTKLEDLKALSDKGNETAGILDFDEATTRKRLIDTQLADLGWKIGEDGANTEEVTQEEEVDNQPTNTGIGYVDYVLWDDNGKPLAVIEAKKTSVSVEKGKKQAEYYADSLEKTYGQRPVIFYTNGYDIWMWDDYKTNGKSNYPPRSLFGFYSKDSLQHLVYQRSGKKALNTISPSAEIAGWDFQLLSIKEVTEKFTNKRRKALIVQATGTGKTRVAISLTELLIRAGWVKRVLFLCDRKELRKQAKNAYNEHLNEPLVIVSKRTVKDRNKRIYLATYPGMIDNFQLFDVGFFDLIIADESHRSIYNVFGDIFKYFDCLQIGLTATPVEFVSRNTYELFECENQLPTAYYSFEQGVEDEKLIPYEVTTYTTEFLRKGIKYSQLTKEQQKEIEERGEELKAEYESKDVDKSIYNKDTARHIIRNLMENGIKDASQQEVGKSIIFARRHEHAMVLQQIFDELYPQYGGKFCQVIDNYDPRAEQLIDDFKDPNHELTIAISVDMLDTGIDVPEIVNLVFAKPIKSKVKFWQMIGRGTRLCENLFGAGKDKTVFQIFDHWGNFDYFEFHYKSKEPSISKSLTQALFEERVKLAENCLQASEPDFFDNVARLISDDINSLPHESIAIKENWKVIHTLKETEAIKRWEAITVASLEQDIAPLMQWVNIRGYSDAYRFDLLMTRMQNDLIKKTSRFEDNKITLLELINNLQMNINSVREKASVIKQVKSKDYWNNVSVGQLEELRLEIRQIIHLQQTTTGGGVLGIQTIDITEDVDGVKIDKRSSMLKSVDMKVFEKEVIETLTQLSDKNPTLQKIRQGKAIESTEMEKLTSLVLTQNPNVDLKTLQTFYKEAKPLDLIIRSLVGMESNSVESRFKAFIHNYPNLNAKQLRFLGLLQKQITKFGLIEIERLFEAPFTNVDTNSIDGVFNESQADELIEVITSFNPVEKIEKKESTQHDQ